MQKILLPILQYLSQVPAVKELVDRGLRSGAESAYSWFFSTSEKAAAFAASVPSLFISATTGSFTLLWYALLKVASAPKSLTFNSSAFKSDSRRPWAMSDSDRVVNNSYRNFSACSCSVSDIVKHYDNVLFMNSFLREAGETFWLLYVLQVLNKYDLDSALDINDFSRKYSVDPDRMKLELLRSMATMNPLEESMIDPLVSFAAVRAVHPSTFVSVIAQREAETLYDTVMLVLAPSAYSALNSVDLRGYENTTFRNPFGVNFIDQTSAENKVENYTLML